MIATAEHPRTETLQPPTERAPYAFDLANEYSRFQEMGDAYRPFFITEAGYYAKEAWGKVPKVMYRHSITEIPGGEKRLWIDEMNCSARESYFAPAHDDTLPTWFRERAQKDGETIVSLEQWLQTAKPGDICFDQSPTEFDVSVEERKKWGYGWHSFTRLHQVVEVDGKIELHSRAKRHYLNEAQQIAMRGMIAADPIDQDLPLMGHVIPVDPELVQNIQNITRLDMITDDCYQSGPDDQRTIPPDDESRMIENDTMDEYLTLTSFQLEEIADLMQSGDSKPSDELIVEIQKRFQGWEMFVTALVAQEHGEPVDEHIDVDALRRFATQRARGITDTDTEWNIRKSQFTYQEKPYERNSATSGCGGGSGWGKKDPFGNEKSIATKNMFQSGKMDYRSLTKESETNYEDYECPKCHTKIKGEKKGSDKSAWTKKCPNSNCDHTFNC